MVRRDRYQQALTPLTPGLDRAGLAMLAPPIAPPAAPSRAGFARLLPGFGFRTRVGLVWALMLVGVLGFFWKLDLDFGVIVDKFPALLGLRLTRQGGLQGAAMTLFLCATSMSLALLIGLLVALGRMSRSATCFAIATFYASFFRGTPFLLQILLIYLGLPQFGPVPAALPSGIVALALNYGAYFSEVIRSGIEAVPLGQREAALSLGLSRFLVLRKIVLPQAMRVIVPPATSLFISSLKDSSLVAVMGIWEIMFLTQSYGRTLFRYMEMLTAAAIIYWVLSLVFEFVQSRIELRMRRGALVQARRTTG